MVGARGIGAALLVLLALYAVLPRAEAQVALIPERRAVIEQDVDFFGGDLGPLFDMPLAACAAACRADPRCAAFTYNTRSAACFPKSGVGERRAFAGAVSARLIATDAGLRAQAAARQTALDFLSAADLRAAADMRLTGEDSAAAWLAEARRALAGADAGDWRTEPVLRERALGAATHAWLRAGPVAEQRAALLAMAEALEILGRGRDALDAMRLAGQAAPGPEVASALERLRGLYGFRVTGHAVESDLAEPRICVAFSEDLRPAGTEYDDYVATRDTGLAVVAEGARLCLEGARHGARYAFTLRAGLPAASGERLAASMPLEVYVRDRAPAAYFPGRGYLLPRGEAVALPLVSVNTSEVALVLRRVDERNLRTAMREGMFGRALDRWQEQRLAEDTGAEVWRGVAEVGSRPNEEVTTRLPLGPVLGGLAPGLYALSARVPGGDGDAAAPTQWFVVSDLGLASMAGADGLHVFVRSLGDAGPVAGARLQLIAADNGVLAEAESDARGYARFAPGLLRGTGGRVPALLSVAAGKRDFAFLDLQGPEFDLSDRGVEGRPAPGPVDLFLTTDRGAYRPGETLHLTALARDGQARAIPGLALTARLLRPDGMEYARAVLPDLGDGGHVGAFDLAPGVPRGAWRLVLHADPEAPPLAGTALLVEDFLPERIDVDLALPERVLDPLGMPMLEVAARFLYGAPAPGLALEGEVTLAPADGLAAWPGFRFGRHDEVPEALREPLPGGLVTDAAGRVELPLPLPRAVALDRPMAVTATVRLSEGSGRPVERRISRPFAGVPMIGLRPLFEGAAPEGAAAEFEVIGLGAGGAPEAMELAWELTRVETRYQWYELYGDWNWEPVTRRSRVASGRLSLTDAGPARLALPVAWGRYELSVSRTDAPHAAASLAFEAGWHVPAGVAETPDRLEAGLDRPAYAPGETARLRLRSRDAGQVLVTVVSDRLIHMQTLAVEPGPVEVALPVTDDWGTGVYVTATLVRPMRAADRQAPARAVGLAWAGVAPGERLLEATFDVDAAAAPRLPLRVGLEVAGIAPGEEVRATIAAVDLGVLNLTGFAPPDPAEQYFGQRRLAMALRDVYGRLIDGLTGEMGRMRQGGDSAPRASGAPPPDEAGIVAFFSGPLVAAAGGRIETAFDLPAFNGTLRLMAVVWSASGVGHAVADVAVRDPVVVQVSAPRFLAPGDESRLRLDLAHVSGPAGEMVLAVRATGGLEVGQPGGTVTLAEAGEARLELPLRATVAGPASIEIALTAPDGRVLRQTVPLPVRANDPAVARTLRLTLDDGETFTLDAAVFAGLRPGTGRATLAAGPVARLDAPALLAALDAFPYGCTEQVISRTLPLLYHAPFAQALGLTAEADIPQRIAGAIREVLLRQAPNGAFGLWSPGAGDFWLDAYATDFLSRARAVGHAVPDAAFVQALDNLRNQVAYAGDFEHGGEGLAYALHVLAREGAALIGDLRYYAEAKAADFATPLALAQLGAALADYGDQARADEMFRAAARRLETAAPPAAPVWRADYGTLLRDRAAVLSLALGAGSEALDNERLIRGLAPDGTPRSTQENLWTLLAAHALAARAGGGAFLIDGAPIAGPVVRMLTADALGAVRSITNHSGRAEALTLTVTGVPDTPPSPGGRGYRIERAHFTPEGRALDPARIALGTRFVTVLTVTPLGPGEARLMVADPLPAGIEIDNPNLLTAGDTSALAWLPEDVTPRHSEARADRYLAAVDWRSEAPFRLAYMARAVSPGVFHHPAPGVEDMYRPGFRAHGASGRMIVTR